MGTKELSKRGKWQTESGKKAKSAEDNIYEALEPAFRGTDFQIRRKPDELKNAYAEIILPSPISEIVYNRPPRKPRSHGIVLDFAIDRLENGKIVKTLYGESKRQDGFVEGKERKDGRGNAHQRSCILFTPGLQKLMRKHGHLGDSVLPFWTVFQGNIARDIKHAREICCWYTGCESHFFLWHDISDATSLLDHFNKLKYLLD